MNTDQLQNDIPVGLACDHAGYECKEYVKQLLTAAGVSVRDFGTHGTGSVDYPDFAHPLAAAVERGECWPGIAVCGTGNGINMTLNKHQGIRSALCWNAEIAALARSHNDANVCVMPGRFIGGATVEAIVGAFLSTPFEGGRHQRRIDKIPL